MCDDTLYAVNLDLCDFFLPGLVEFKYTLAKWIDTYPALQDYDADQVANKALTLDGDITLDTAAFATAQWFDLEVEIDKNGFLVTPIGKPVKYYTTTLRGYVPSSSRENTWALHKAGKSKLVMAGKDRNGDWRILGSKDNPFFCAAVFDTGEKAGDENAGFTLDGLWNASGEPPAYYDGTF